MEMAPTLFPTMAPVFMMGALSPVRVFCSVLAARPALVGFGFWSAMRRLYMAVLSVMGRRRWRIIGGKRNVDVLLSWSRKGQASGQEENRQSQIRLHLEHLSHGPPFFGRIGQSCLQTHVSQLQFPRIGAACRRVGVSACRRVAATRVAGRCAPARHVSKLRALDSVEFTRAVRLAL
jgi:hypothetical protein